MARLVIRLKDRLSCTGCGVCLNACPKACITMQSDEEGFLVPHIDSARCCGCGKCKSACDRIDALSLHARPDEAIAFWAKEKRIRCRSSSGGFFSTLAESILDAGGVVNGVLFDNKMHLRHVLIERKSDLGSICGSKYVQSDVAKVYIDIKQALEDGRRVLFTSTPCQVAGLRAFLGKEYERLVTCDFICHGVPSPEYFEKYIADGKIESGRNDVVDYRFRNLEGWGWDAALIFSDASKISHDAYTDLFMSPFLAGLNYRESCYSCRYARPERCADITMGDFWSIKDYVVCSWMFERGCSLVLLNSKKGRRWFESIKPKCNFKTLPLYTTYSNEQLWKPSKRPILRDDFYNDSGKLSKKDFSLKYGIYAKNRHPLHMLADIYRCTRRKLNAIKFTIKMKCGVV